MARAAKPKAVDIDSLKHREARRKHIPTAELESLVTAEEQAPQTIRYKRNTDLDPQLVWRGKDQQDAEDLLVDSVPIYIQEKIQPEAIIADLKRRSDAVRRERAENQQYEIPDLYSDFNGLAEAGSEYGFYKHDKNWSNRVILGDSLLVMTSLAAKEALKGQVQCIYMDPPYGKGFNSNWQPSTKSRDVKDGQANSVTREPEMIRAFRDTWKDGIHSYLSYLRDRLIVARNLLAENGSIFVQIGDENVHRVRALMDEVFGSGNAVSFITIQKAGSTFARYLGGICDFVLWYAKDIDRLKYRELFADREMSDEDTGRFTIAEPEFSVRVPLSSLGRLALKHELIAPDPLQSASIGREKGEGAASWFPVETQGGVFRPTMQSRWKTNEAGMARLLKADRILMQATTIRYARRFLDFPVAVLTNIWSDLAGAGDKIYVVQTSPRIVERCISMTTDPGDLVLDPTCGSGTTAYVAEQWGRRWITIDTSRVALALARQRIMAARYQSYLLQDSPEGAQKEAELSGRLSKEGPFNNSVRQGFVYARVPHIKLEDIAHNAEIDVIWEKWQPVVTRLLDGLKQALGKDWQDWEIPRDAGDAWPADAAKRWAFANGKNDPNEIAKAVVAINTTLGRRYTPDTLPDAPRDPWPEEPTRLHAEWWEAKRDRQKEMDASIARNAEIEYLVDRPYEDRRKVRVAGPFTVESLSPHRVLSAEEDDATWADEIAEEIGRPLPKRTRSDQREEARQGEDDFVRAVLDNLLKAGVQNTKKGEKLEFTELKPWPGGRLIHAEGRYDESGTTRRGAVTIGPEYGTVSYGLVREAAREALDSVFDTLIVCGFAFEPRVNDEALTRFPRLTVLKARMNTDLHLADSLRSQTNNANLFVIFGEPDIKIHPDEDGRVRVEIAGLDIFDPTTGEVRSSSIDDIAAWFIDTDYDGDSFFVRHAYFLGGNDPYKRLKGALKAEIDEAAWATLYSAVSRPFDRPETGRIAVKVINHYGDEVLKIYPVS
jgi:adenine-specific DNA-methyltransferase